MRDTKIVIIGAGSTDFGPGIIADVLINPALRGSTLSLVDINAENLGTMSRLAARMNETWASGVTIESTTDRTQALPGAEFVIVAVEVDRINRWRMDWEIPLKHGVRQPLGENGGPGGFAHAARNVPIVLGICADMRRLCPDAWLFNFTNPVPRITLTAHRYGGVKAAGFCHGIGIAYSNLARLLGMRSEELDIKAAGLNHFTWVLDLRRQATGEDLYPTLRALVPNWPEGDMPLTRDLLAITGLFPVCGDTHLAEYLPWVTDPALKPWEKYHIGPTPWEHWEQWRQQRRQQLARMLAGEEPIDEFRHGSGERAIPTAAAIAHNGNSFEQALNVPNVGAISNLPEGAVVEVPALVSGRGIEALALGDLPEPVAELCRRQAVVAGLAVQAAVTGDRAVALQALLLDPMVSDLAQAQAILDEYLTAHAALLPQFRKLA
jgi:alpha-galactosidase